MFDDMCIISIFFAIKTFVYFLSPQSASRISFSMLSSAPVVPRLLSQQGRVPEVPKVGFFRGKISLEWFGFKRIFFGMCVDVCVSFFWVERLLAFLS